MNHDLFRDWLQILRARLVAAGLPVAPADRDEIVYAKYRHHEQRRIEARPREVLRAEDFSVLHLAPDEQRGVERIAAKATTGDTLLPHLSLGVRNFNGTDLLLMDWGIYHLHLSLAPHPTAPGFFARTGPVLFARVTRKRFLMLGVMPHGSWASEDAFNKVVENWPEEFELYRMRGAVGLEQQITEADRILLRQAGINPPIQASNGAVYAPPGGGLTTAGTSINATREMIAKGNGLARLAEDIERKLAAFPKLPDEFGRPPSLRLEADGALYRIVEASSGAPLCEGIKL